MRLLRATSFSLLSLLLSLPLFGQHASSTGTTAPATSRTPASTPTYTSAPASSASPSHTPTSPPPTPTHTQPSVYVDHESRSKQANAPDAAKSSAHPPVRAPLKTEQGKPEKIKAEKIKSEKFKAEKSVADKSAVGPHVIVRNQGEKTKKEIKQEKKDRKAKEKQGKQEKREKDKKAKIEIKKKKAQRAALKNAHPILPCSASSHRQCVCADGSLSDKVGRCSIINHSTSQLFCPSGETALGGVCQPVRRSNNCESLAAQLRSLDFQLQAAERKRTEACQQGPNSFECERLTAQYHHLLAERDALHARYESCNP